MIDVLFVDPREAVRQIMAFALSQHPTITVAQVRSPLQAVAEAVKRRPDVVVIDAGLPWGDVLHATRLMVRQITHCQVLLVNGEEEPSLLLASLQAGARGYLPRSSGIAELLSAIQAMAKGELAVPLSLLAALVPMTTVRREEHDGARGRLDRLTSQEQRVLLLLVRGADNRGMGEALGISPQTARTHVQHILRKLRVHSRLEAIAFVNRHGLLGALELSSAVSGLLEGEPA